MTVVDLAKDRHPWDRQPGESDQAWAAFVAYRDLGADRSIRAAVEKLEKPKTYNSTAQQFSQKNGWRIRVEAYDREQDRLRREHSAQLEREKAERVNEEMTKTAESLWKLAARGAILWHNYLEDHQKRERKRVQKAIEQNKEAPPLSKPTITPKDLQALADTGVKLHRTLDGEPGSISEIRGGTFAELVRLAREESEEEDEFDSEYRAVK